MKKALLALIALIVIFAVSTCTWAEDLDQLKPISPLTQLNVWKMEVGQWGVVRWVPLNSSGAEIPGGTQYARAWAQYNYCIGDLSGCCNREKWYCGLLVKACIAQWIDWSICGGNETDWQIQKPGVYVADPVKFTVRSNDDVDLDFYNFTNLVSYTDPGAPAIPIFWACETNGVTPPPANSPDWHDVGYINKMAPITIHYSDFVNGPVSRYLWHKLIVGPEIRACSYWGGGGIILKVTDLKPYICPATGNWNGKTDPY